MPKILIVGGGYAGFYTAWKLEKHLAKNEAEVIVVDPLPYMTYQPFLPEVVAGSIEPRHSVVALRRHLKKTTVITARVTQINHARKTATITPDVGDAWDVEYDQIVVTAGAVSRTFPIPGEGTPWQFSAVRYSMINVMLLPGWPGRCDPH